MITKYSWSNTELCFYHVYSARQLKRALLWHDLSSLSFLLLFFSSVCHPPPTFLTSWLNYSTNKEGHIGPVAPQQEDKWVHGQEGIVCAREGSWGGSHGLHPILGQCKEPSVSDIVQNQPVFRVKATQIGILKEWRQPWWEGTSVSRAHSRPLGGLRKGANLISSWAWTCLAPYPVWFWAEWPRSSGGPLFSFCPSSAAGCHRSYSLPPAANCTVCRAAGCKGCSPLSERTCPPVAEGLWSVLSSATASELKSKQQHRDVSTKQIEAGTLDNILDGDSESQPISQDVLIMYIFKPNKMVCSYPQLLHD